MSDLFDRLPQRARASVRAFQMYAVRRGDGSTARRRGVAKGLIQNVAAEIAEAYELDPAKPLLAFNRLLPVLNIRLRWDRESVSIRRGELVPEPGGFVSTIYDPQRKRSTRDTGQLEFQWKSNSTVCNTADLGRVGRRSVFTLSHELAHAFFYRCDRPAATPRRIVPKPLSRGEERREEALCNSFAGAMLLPDCVASALPDNPRLADFVAAWRNWFVPFETIVRRSMYDWELACPFVALRLRRTGSTWEPRPFWGSEYRRSRGMRKKAARRLEVVLASRVDQADAMSATDIRNSLRRRGIDSHYTGTEVWAVFDRRFLTE